MSAEAITEALHDYMYEKLNDSLETEVEKKIRHLMNEREKVPKNQWTNHLN